MIEILLIEQEYLYQKVFHKIIEKHKNCNLVAVAENGMEAKHYAEKYHPQYVFAEAFLGCENGIDICRNIKRNYPDIKTFILSNFRNRDLINSAIQAGVERYFLKPFTEEAQKELFAEEIIEDNDEENEIYHRLIQSIEKKDYILACEVAKEVVDDMFKNVDVHKRKEYFRSIAQNLFCRIPGMDSSQRNYYLQKYELKGQIIYQEILVYFSLISLITDIFRQFCVMKYAYMNLAFQYIENKMYDEISLTELSELVGISKGYLSRIFKKYYRLSVVDYIHLRKIAAAKKYMASTEMNISEISYLLGYNEAGYFCKIFKKYQKMTPTAYEKRYIQ